MKRIESTFMLGSELSPHIMGARMLYTQHCTMQAMLVKSWVLKHAVPGYIRADKKQLPEQTRLIAA